MAFLAIYMVVTLAMAGYSRKPNRLYKQKKENKQKDKEEDEKTWSDQTLNATTIKGEDLAAMHAGAVVDQGREL
ncbi:hypothetical protein L2E82_47463 [Cichorium intybus]|uniref:Uncharacterized protein n=1 Tax=Cichorium intybus TaxID=13427 RepID=A0ACB8YVU0_CICIN|nr:hypothetical protein L2E82_47463 [Cichorium intybus]